MKDQWGNEVNVGDYVICSPIWGSQRRRFVLAKVTGVGEKKRIKIDFCTVSNWKEVKKDPPMWIENFVKVDEDWASRNYEKSLAGINDRSWQVGDRP